MYEIIYQKKLNLKDFSDLLKKIATMSELKKLFLNFKKDEPDLYAEYVTLNKEEIEDMSISDMPDSIIKIVETKKIEKERIRLDILNHKYIAFLDVCGRINKDLVAWGDVSAFLGEMKDCYVDLDCELFDENMYGATKERLEDAGDKIIKVYDKSYNFLDPIIKVDKSDDTLKILLNKLLPEKYDSYRDTLRKLNQKLSRTITQICSAETDIIEGFKSLLITHINDLQRQKSTIVKVGNFPHESYYLNDLLKDCGCIGSDPIIFESREEATYFILERAVKCIAIIHDKDKTCIIRTDGEHGDSLSLIYFKTISSNYKTSKVTYKEVGNKGKMKDISVPIFELIENCEELIYRSVENIPYHEHENFADIPGYKASSFNIFPGFKVSLGEDPKGEIPDTIKPILDHYYNVIANENEEVFKYVIAWEADIIQNPRKKNGVSLVFMGPPGSGKGIIPKFMEQYIYGEQSATTLNGLSQLNSRFNSHLAGKLSVSVDELSIVNNDFSATFDQMKNTITDDKILLESKGVNGKYVSNLMRFRFMSNHEHVIKIEKDDRRYTVIKTNPKYRAKFEDQTTNPISRPYFNELGSKIENKQVAKDWFTYLYYYDISGFDLRTPLTTDIKRELIDLSRPKHEHYFEAVYNRDIRFDHEHTENVLKIKSSELFEHYIEWFTRGKYRGNPLNDKIFGKEVVKYFNHPKPVKIRGSRGVELKICDYDREIHGCDEYEE